MITGILKPKLPNPRTDIESILKQMPPQEALDLINSIAKRMRQSNSIRINKGSIKNVIDADRPDLVHLKK